MDRAIVDRGVQRDRPRLARKSWKEVVIRVRYINIYIDI